MEQLIRGLEKNGQISLSDSSCEAELQELMKQIDIMVNRKKVDWERQSQVLETRLEVREQELTNARTCLDQKHREVGMLRQQLEGFERSHRAMVQKYEEQLNNFKSELYKLRNSYEKLEKHQMKQRRESYSAQNGESEETRLELNRLNRKLEEFRVKSREWDKQRFIYQSQMASLEGQRKALSEKCECIQQIQGHKDQWISRNATDLGESEIRNLKCRMKSAEETIRSDEATIEELKTTIENMTTNKKLYQEEKQHLLEEIKCYQRRCQNLESELSELKIELQSRDDLLQVGDMEQKQLRKELASVKGVITQTTNMNRTLETCSQKLATSSLVNNLKTELEHTLKQLQGKIKNETMLQSEVTRLKAGLDSSHKYSMQKNDELSKNEEELRRLQHEHTQGDREINRLRDSLYQMEQSQSSEIEGFRTEVSNLTAELHQRDITIATVREKAAHLERQLKIELEKEEQIFSESQVAMIQLQSLKVENKQMKEMVKMFEVKRPMRADEQVKELQNTYAASISKLEYENKRLQKDIGKLQAVLEMSSKASQEKYEAALRHTQQAVAEMKEHEDGRVKKLRQENQQQMSAMKGKLKETIQHYEEKIKVFQKDNPNHNNLEIFSPRFIEQENVESSLKRRPTSTEWSSDCGCFFHSTDLLSEQFPDVNMSGISLTSTHRDSFMSMPPTEMSDTTSVAERFLHEEEKRARELEKMLNSHIDELQHSSKCTVETYTEAKQGGHSAPSWR
ncbi:deuterosome assembly protein 1 [Callorhinchus milii]|uniref:deuterosome assembly protein 1 n=1 Tax=Callorhinchus milii TaxID=7868 RepID=UPI001C3FF0FC|nr:deuterosome assembly protein 1 [Callorhinchus milii]